MANAQLIAAAPDLLNALELAIKWLAKTNSDSTILEVARLAVAKAKGKIYDNSIS